MTLRVKSQVSVPQYKIEDVKQDWLVWSGGWEFLYWFGGSSSVLRLSLFWGIWRNRMQNGGDDFSVAILGSWPLEERRYLLLKRVGFGW